MVMYADSFICKTGPKNANISKFLGNYSHRHLVKQQPSQLFSLFSAKSGQRKIIEVFRIPSLRAIEFHLHRAPIIALMHVYVRLACFTTKPRFRSANLQIS